MMSWSIDDVTSQAGRVALVTGANSGLGFEVAKALADKGATVLMACRNADKAEAAAQKIREGSPSGSVEVISLDLGDLSSVHGAAALVRARTDRLDLLINNAGLMATDASLTADGFETQIGVNHLGHFVLTLDLVELLAATPGSRVVSVSSFGHRAAGRFDASDLNFTRRGYKRWPAYFQSKLANLLFTRGLAERLDAAHVATIAVAAHPGAARTDLGVEGTGLTNKVLAPIYPYTTQSAVAGAQPILRAALDPSVRNGEFYGPQFLFFGKAVRETPTRQARSDANAQALWDASVALTGATFPELG